MVFIGEVGLALSTVTSLELSFEDTSGSDASAAVLDQARVQLVNLLPALKSLANRGPLSPEFLLAMGQACPHLSALTLIAGSDDLKHVQATLQLQPLLLPNINSLTFQTYGSDYILPDISNNSNIRCLDAAGHRFKTAAQWRRLPQNLLSLRCYTVGGSVPAVTANGSPLLSSLQSLTLEVNDINPFIALRSLAQVLRAAPVLTSVKFEDDCGPPSIDCDFNEFTDTASAASDLSLLLQRPEVDVVKDGEYRICFDDRQSQAVLETLINGLPCMQGVASCELRGMVPGELSMLVKKFPDAERLLIQHTHESYQDDMLLDDEELLCVSACRHLKWLHITGCEKITALGLLTLCQRLPLLTNVDCYKCAQLTEPVMQKCVELLGKFGTFVEMNGLKFDQN